MKKRKIEKHEKKKKNSRGFGPSIRLQLAIGFIVPILFVISVGNFAYEKAKESLIGNYEEATLNSITMGSRYLDFGFSLVASDTLQLSLDSSLADYSYGSYVSDPAQGNIVYNKLQSTIQVKEASNAFVQSISIVPRNGGKLLSTKTSGGTPFFDEWAASEEGRAMMSGKSNFKWVGSHPFIDEKTGISQEDYALSYMGILTNKAAVVVMDISSKAVLDSLKNLNLGEGSVVAFVTADNRQVSYYQPAEAAEAETAAENSDESAAADLAFYEQDFYNNCVNAETESGSEYISYNGVDYLFMYGKAKVSGGMICALVPRSVVIQGAEQIREVTSLIVIAACIVVLLLAVGISINISAGISRITGKLKQVSGGDLTVQLHTGGHSEFSRLAANIAAVIQNTGELIRKVEGTLQKVQSSTQDVALVSDQIFESTENISVAVRDIDDGVSHQSNHVQNCAAMMEQLSDRIESITGSVAQAGEIADSTGKMIRTGQETMSELSEQSHSTTRITDEVQNNIVRLEQESSKISHFIDIINDIAKQTNLLSLNASIEAARAGEAGRGFSVVAGEIQKLAEESVNAAKEIDSVVELISRYTMEAVDAAGSARQIVDQQTDTVVKTQQMFEQMSEHTGRLLAKLNTIGEDVRQADEGRKVTMAAIDEISAVSVETAAASGVVNKTTQGQLDVTERLRVAADGLNRDMKELTEALSVFKL